MQENEDYTLRGWYSVGVLAGWTGMWIVWYAIFCLDLHQYQISSPTSSSNGNFSAEVNINSLFLFWNLSLIVFLLFLKMTESGYLETTLHSNNIELLNSYLERYSHSWCYKEQVPDWCNHQWYFWSMSQLSWHYGEMSSYIVVFKACDAMLWD